MKDLRTGKVIESNPQDTDERAPLGSENDWSIMYNPEEDHDGPEREY